MTLLVLLPDVQVNTDLTEGKDATLYSHRHRNKRYLE